jgi:hypothetical protein
MASMAAVMIWSDIAVSAFAGGFGGTYSKMLRREGFGFDCEIERKLNSCIIIEQSVSAVDLAAGRAVG